MSKLDNMIAEESRLCGATRMVRLLADNDLFSPEVQQAIRLEGMKLLSEPRNFALSGAAVLSPLPNPAMSGFSVRQAMEGDAA